MHNKIPLITERDGLPIKVWVLAPYLATTDANIGYYYDFTQSIEEYTRVFTELGLAWHWQPVTMEDFNEIIGRIAEERNEGNCFPVVLNLCDGDEINGTPGLSVVRELTDAKLVYTGADEHFYRITTSKIPMKTAFDNHGVTTAPWQSIVSENHDYAAVLAMLGAPIIAKPAISGGSMGVGVRNVVHTAEELEEQVNAMFGGYRGWDLVSGGIVAEKFITGPEFTTMVVGTGRRARVLEPVERVFHPSLPEEEKFLSFDRLWEIYEDESPMPGHANFYEYRRADRSLVKKLKQLSLDAYHAVGGKGYTRIDIRMDGSTGDLYVLEVNAQCGLSEDENFTSIGAILKASRMPFAELIRLIINDALLRHAQPSPAIH